MSTYLGRTMPSFFIRAWRVCALQRDTEIVALFENMNEAGSLPFR
jgi:hypothetical protein